MHNGGYTYYDKNSLYPSPTDIIMLVPRHSTVEELRQIEETLYILLSDISGLKLISNRRNIYEYKGRLRDAYRNFNIFMNTYINLLNKSEVETIAELLTEIIELRQKLERLENNEH